MKILLTGYKGFIGSHMYHSLLKQGHQVVGYDWEDKFPAIKKFDWVIHIGAISSTTERDVAKIIEQNYDFSVMLYKEARHHEVNFQFSSSASVYGLNTEFKEDSPVDPRTPYAWSKYMVEHFIHTHPPRHSIAQIFRYFNVYGPEGEEHKGSQASPFAKFRKQQQETGQVQVFEGSDKYLRDFIHVSKVVEMQTKFLSVPESGIYNIGTGQAQSFLEAAKQCSDNIIEIPMPEILKSSYQLYTCADMQKTTQILQKYHV
jgi:ADP-L-glycero-D-manno-heptose 6-epimerase